MLPSITVSAHHIPEHVCVTSSAVASNNDCVYIQLIHCQVSTNNVPMTILLHQALLWLRKWHYNMASKERTQ